MRRRAAAMAVVMLVPVFVVALPARHAVAVGSGNIRGLIQDHTRTERGGFHHTSDGADAWGVEDSVTGAHSFGNGFTGTAHAQQGYNETYDGSDLVALTFTAQADAQTEPFMMADSSFGYSLGFSVSQETPYVASGGIEATQVNIPADANAAGGHVELVNVFEFEQSGPGSRAIEATGTLPPGFYTLTIGGGAGAASLGGEGNTSAVATVNFTLSLDVPCDNVFTAGPDVIDGTGGPDILCGGGGNDVIEGLGGNDTIIGGAGDDEILGGNGNDEIRGEDGNDTISGDGPTALQTGRDVIDAGAGDDTVAGGAHEDTIIGGDGAGADTLRGGSGADQISGGDGGDFLFGQGGADDIAGGPGEDRISGGARNDRIDAGSGDDPSVNGDGGQDVLEGGSDDDRLNGGGGGDTLRGRGGGDVLVGRTGPDILDGGSENDVLNACDGTRDVVIGGEGSGDRARADEDVDDVRPNVEDVEPC